MGGGHIKVMWVGYLPDVLRPPPHWWESTAYQLVAVLSGVPRRPWFVDVSLCAAALSRVRVHSWNAGKERQKLCLQVEIAMFTKLNL